MTLVLFSNINLHLSTDFFLSVGLDSVLISCFHLWLFYLCGKITFNVSFNECLQVIILFLFHSCLFHLHIYRWKLFTSEDWKWPSFSLLVMSVYCLLTSIVCVTIPAVSLILYLLNAGYIFMSGCSSDYPLSFIVFSILLWLVQVWSFSI